MKDPRTFDALSLEVLIDIRDLLKKPEPAPLYVKEPKAEPKVKRKRRTKREMAAARRK